MPALEVTAAGFSVPRLPEARARVVEVWRARWGENSDTSSDTTDGKVIDDVALLLALAWQGAAASSSNAYARTAEGVHLDLVLDLFARRRQAARASQASLVWYGTDSTIVGVGSLAGIVTTGARFATDAEATIGGDDSTWVVRVDTIQSSALYRVTYNAVNYDYTSDGSASADEIVAGILAALAAVSGLSALAAGEDADGLRLIVLEGAAGATLTVGARLTRYHAVRVAATATVTGPQQGLTGTIRQIVNPQAGIVGITSTADAVVGSAVETDGQFLTRHLRTLSANGARSPDAIADRLVDPEGPTQCDDASVVENEGPTVDADGRPPHSFETYVLGGDDAAIAALIWQQKPAGIRAYGSTVVQTLGRDGRPHSVGFTRPTELYLHLEITVVPGEGYPSSGTPLTTIAAAVATYFGNGGAGELDRGEDFYRIAVAYPALSAVPGIAGLTVRTATTAAPDDPPTFAAADVTVAIDEILRADSSRITML